MISVQKPSGQSSGIGSAGKEKNGHSVTGSTTSASHNGSGVQGGGNGLVSSHSSSTNVLSKGGIPRHP
jgi:hypothetical protein